MTFFFSIMVRFRTHIFAFTTDVKNMNNMTQIHPDNWKLQQIVWKERIDGPIKTFDLEIVPWGTNTPFLAKGTLKQTTVDETNQFPLAEQIELRDMYIDDAFSCAETLNEAEELQ